tara:strand:- start:794 stop:1816 length:1023 start_codon:yes stop_codon:yes gene_type:complete
MQKYLTIIFIFFYCTNTSGATLFDTEFYEIKFISDNVEKTKIEKISEIKFESIKSIFKKILTKNDFKSLEREISEDLINTFIQNIILEDEIIINNNYYSKIKINFNPRIIITFLRNNNLKYVEFLPDNFLTIIYNKSIIEKSLLSTNNKYYNYLLSNNLNFYFLPNLDLNDRFLINYYDIEKRNLNKINRFAKKYNKYEILIIISDKTNDKTIYESFLITNNEIYKLPNISHNKVNYGKLFSFLKNETLDVWKINNSIQNEITYTLNCSIQYFNLLELKEIKKNIKNILMIKKMKLLNFSYMHQNYEIRHFGNKKVLFKLFKINNLKIIQKNNKCNISLI